uniref:Uncharacterized protein n=1 Tax=viral metagenome TaxID=1070528 RepID=A0A6C0F9Y9_9ZZZZ|tara:strand:- start:1325 stop:1642 length:318 start_codon:yes stop_codon:yes gene_type:complete
MLFSLRGCTPCKREGFSDVSDIQRAKRVKRSRVKKKGQVQPAPVQNTGGGKQVSPSVIYENQDKVTRLKSEMCDNREYMKLEKQVENLQKSVTKIKDANSKLANT